MFKIVVDTDVMVAAFERATGASRQVVLDIVGGKAVLLLSTSLLLEYEAVLTRRENLARSGLSSDAVIEVLDDLVRGCGAVVFDYRWRPMARDADDDLVLETAINGGADVIATFNIADMVEGATRFGIPVERPALVLRRLRT
jgi:putative PIN family toxin of toxin-antitoxin system